MSTVVILLAVYLAYRRIAHLIEYHVQTATDTFSMYCAQEEKRRAR